MRDWGLSHMVPGRIYSGLGNRLNLLQQAQTPVFTLVRRGSALLHQALRGLAKMLFRSGLTKKTTYIFCYIDQQVPSA